MSSQRFFRLFACLILSACVAHAELRLPAQFGEGAVLQRETAWKLRGWATPGAIIEIRLDGQHTRTTASGEGRWQASMDPLDGGGPYVLHLQTDHGDDLEHPVWAGEVWVASGQSNMQWTIDRSRNADLHRAIWDYPEIRILRVAPEGSADKTLEFDDAWRPATRGNLGDMSAIGFHFAQILHEYLGVPVGIIDVSWGGSAIEAWMDRDLLATDPRFRLIDELWREFEQRYDFAAEMERHEGRIAAWERRRDAALRRGEDPPRQPRAPRNLMKGNQRPGNIFNNRVQPLLGTAIGGVIWYQGESNARDPELYAELFPAMIGDWRDRWGQGNFPFYWVQLTAFRNRQPSGPDASWAFLREAQSRTRALPRTGEAVTIDIGDGADIHPWEKEEVARRLARWALAHEYEARGIAYAAPRIAGWEPDGEHVRIHFANTDGGLLTREFDVVHGFAVAGEDRAWHTVEGHLINGREVRLEVPPDVRIKAVRYAWADNPLVNLYSTEGLPVTPWRSDTWERTGERQMVPRFLTDEP